MQPSAWTRLTDGVFERADGLVERVDRFEATIFSPQTSRLKRMAYGFAAALFGALVVAAGESVVLGPYAGPIAVPSILIAAVIGSLFAFKGRNPPREPPHILLGVALFVLITAGVWLGITAMNLPTQ
jgi:hypothetical protein